jgi:hypothetical protein
MKNYLCLQTTVRREDKAAAFLKERGIETYAPQTVTVVRLSPRKVYERLVPLFPAYFFAESDSFYEARARFGDIIYPFRLRSHVVGTLDGDAVEEIKSREHAGVVYLPKERKRLEMPFERDEKVILNGLSMVNIQAIFKEYIPEKERVLVLLNMLGRELVAPLSLKDVVVSKLAYA